MEDSIFHVIFVILIVISKIAESGYERKIFEYFKTQIEIWDCTF
jgi:hypothetical protein